ncbi:MAG: DNA-directed RNA polymerase subunit alpha C-terminal domain-containing protein [Planctomycetota bacterium]|jgi:hypothetical protein
MTEQNHPRKLDLSAVNVRARSALQRLGVETIEQLLSLTEKDLSPLRNCGRKTIAKIMTLQKYHSKGSLFVKLQRERIDRAAESRREYISRLIIVVIAAREVLKGAARQDSYYFRVTRQRINTLRQALEALKKQQ